MKEYLVAIGQRTVAQLQPVENTDFIKVPQPVAQMSAGDPLSDWMPLNTKIPWGHNILLMKKVKDLQCELGNELDES